MLLWKLDSCAKLSDTSSKRDSQTYYSSQINLSQILALQLLRSIVDQHIKIAILFDVLINNLSLDSIDIHKIKWNAKAFPASRFNCFPCALRVFFFSGKIDDR